MKKFFIITPLILLTLSGCQGIAARESFNEQQPASRAETTQNLPDTEIKSVSLYEFKKLMAKPKYTLIDIRTPEETAQGKIQSSAIEIDFYADDFQNKLSSLDRTGKYLIYCRSGNRTGQTLKIMQDLGFETAYDLDGGINVWDEELESQNAKLKFL